MNICNYLKFLLLVCVLTLGFKEFTYASEDYAPAEAKSDAEEVEKEDEEAATELPHLSGVGWETYASLGALPPAGPIPSMDTLKHYIKQYLYHEGTRTEACKAIARRAWKGTNTVIVHVFYQNGGEIRHHKIPRVFVSGWDYKNKGFESREVLEEEISRSFQDRIIPIWLGDFYRLPEGKTIGNAPVEGIINEKGGNLIGDFAARGLRIEPRIEKKPGKPRKLINKKFSVSTYGHSEEAFISYLQNGNSTIADTIPQGVMLLVVSTNAPCGTCNSVFINLIKDLAFRRNMLQAMFPRIGPEEDIPLSIVYGAVDEFGKVRLPKDRDLTDTIDSLATTTYILSMKNVRGRK
jgi:hypothetical protein